MEFGILQWPRGSHGVWCFQKWTFEVFDKCESVGADDVREDSDRLATTLVIDGEDVNLVSETHVRLGASR